MVIQSTSVINRFCIISDISWNSIEIRYKDNGKRCRQISFSFDWTMNFVRYNFTRLALEIFKTSRPINCILNTYFWWLYDKIGIPCLKFSPMGCLSTDVKSINVSIEYILAPYMLHSARKPATAEILDKSKYSTALNSISEMSTNEYELWNPNKVSTFTRQASLSWNSRCCLNDLICPYTVYPKKYAHGFCFTVLCCGYTLTDFPISTRLTSLALWQSNSQCTM